MSIKIQVFCCLTEPFLLHFYWDTFLQIQRMVHELFKYGLTDIVISKENIDELVKHFALLSLPAM